jgi:gas vesicle protein
VSERTAVAAGMLIGTVVGGLAGYLFFTERGRQMRDRLEPALDDLQREFIRFRGTVEQVGRVASEGMRVFEEFQSARSQSNFEGGGTSH